MTQRVNPASLVVLAAGVGSRFGGAKQLEPFGPGGETLLEMNVYDAALAGVERVVVVTSRALLPAIERVLERLPSAVSTRAVVQGERVEPDGPIRERPWGTAHAVLAAGIPDGPAIVANADDLYGRAALGALAGTLDALPERPGPRVSPPPAAPAGMVPSAFVCGYRLDRTLSAAGGVSRGVCRADSGGRLRSIEEVVELRRADGRIVGRDSGGRETEFRPDTVVSMNLWALGRKWWPRLAARLDGFAEEAGEDPHAEFRLPDAVQAEIAAGALVRVVPTSADWVGVTYAADVPWVRSEVARRFSEGQYPSPLFQ